MPDRISAPAAFVTIAVNGRTMRMPPGSTVAAAMLNSDSPCRLSESREPRAPLCGMGICFECRAIIDGVPHQRTCQIACREGMNVETQQ
jgi:sarcosine oxidase subunit alpha